MNGVSDIRQITYYICDVFTDQQFGGNPLAVIPDAQGLTSEQMQKIAREFNFSESTFVLPPSQGHSREVRIFTPSREVPFAGHPNVGTAYVLSEIGALTNQVPIVFEEKAGLVTIESRESAQGKTLYQLEAPETFSVSQQVPVELVAEALSLPVEAISVTTHHPCVASSGLAFVLAEVVSVEALKMAKITVTGFEKIAELGVMPDIHVYARSQDEYDIRARMFAPFDGVNEDPATGSANCALAGLIAACDPAEDKTFNFRIMQGEEMGRPSLLDAYAVKEAGQVVATGVAGSAVMFSQGTISLRS